MRLMICIMSNKIDIRTIMTMISTVPPFIQIFVFNIVLFIFVPKSSHLTKLGGKGDRAEN